MEKRKEAGCRVSFVVLEVFRLLKYSLGTPTTSATVPIMSDMREKAFTATSDFDKFEMSGIHER